MVAEMALASRIIDPNREVRQIALGGGTPNYLEADQIDHLLRETKRIWKIAEGAELSVEIDPRTSTPEKLDRFLSHGFNRFSLGIQDLNGDVLGIIRRGQGVMQVEEVIDHLRENGCQRINFDLIFGLPGQTLESVDQTSRTVCGLKPSRIALYSYAHVPWIQPHQKSLEKAGLPHPEPDISPSAWTISRCLRTPWRKP
jgi:oxygen-independent coproporphyrinogen-3 oxidase